MTLLNRRAWLALLLLTACEPKEIKVALTIVHSSCDPQSDPYTGVGFFRVRITGEKIDTPIDVVAAAGAMGSLTIPQIPAGNARVIEVRGYDMDPTAGGKVLSIGKSLPFKINDVIADPTMNDPIPVSIFLRLHHICFLHLQVGKRLLVVCIVHLCIYGI